MEDRYNRKIDYLRISITDRCNLKCIYCMPPCGIDFLEHSEVLTYDEIIRVCKIAVQLGIRKIKITGGEPLIREDIIHVVRSLKSIKEIEEITMTTNGILLPKFAKTLKAAGLSRINISVDTLRKDKFLEITGCDEMESVKEGIEEAVKHNLKTKINCVPIKGMNNDEVMNIVQIAKDNPIDVRFIELMPIGYGKNFQPITNKEIIKKIEDRYGKLKSSSSKHGNGPAIYYNINQFSGSIGFISALTNEFCGSCNRIRLTADGKLKLCLHNNKTIDIKKMIRAGLSDPDLASRIKAEIYGKPQHHNFKSKNQGDIEQRNMIQIGG